MGASSPRVKFYEEALTSQEITELKVTEREVAGFYLKQSAYPPAFRIPKHSHARASLYIVLRGTSTEIYGNQRWECKPLSLVFTPPDEVHSEHYDDAGGSCFIFEPTPSRLGQLREYSVRLESANTFYGGVLAWLTMKVYNECRQMDEVSSLTIEGLGLEIMAELARHSAGAKRKPPHWLLQARDLLHSQFSENLTLDVIAKSVGVHPVHLASTFRQHFACTVGEYVRRLRIESACRQISGSDAPLVEIALAAGFSDQSHLTKTFRRLTGLSPAQFRATIRSA
jgi:AraC family transcriptional regulator